MNKLLIFFFIIFFSTCNSSHKSPVIKKEDVRLLKKKYSKEVFDYFHEVMFFKESSRKKSHIKKWESDISFCILGTVTKQDENYVKKSLEKLNKVGLPIKLILTNDEAKANVKVYFGSIEELKNTFMLNTNIKGVASTYSVHGTMKSGKIGILQNSTKNRESLILEEITQVLGSISDSYSYPYSIHYQGANNPLNFSELDNQVLKLLYDKSLPAGLNLEEFEKSFNEVLTQVNTSKKLKRFMKKEKITKEVLSLVSNSCFIDSVFYKHPKEIDLYLNGVTQTDSIFVTKAIKAFNNISENLHLTISKKSINSPDSGITINIEKDESVKLSARTKILNHKGEMFKIKRFKSDIYIDIKNDNIEQKKRESVILKSIYKALGPTLINTFDEDWYTITNGDIKFAKNYQKIIEVIYSNEFVDGLTLKQFNEITD